MQIALLVRLVNDLIDTLKTRDDHEATGSSTSHGEYLSAAVTSNSLAPKVMSVLCTGIRRITADDIEDLKFHLNSSGTVLLTTPVLNFGKPPCLVFMVRVD